MGNFNGLHAAFATACVFYVHMVAPMSVRQTFLQPSIVHFQIGGVRGLDLLPGGCRGGVPRSAAGLVAVVVVILFCAPVDRCGYNVYGDQRERPHGQELSRARSH